MFQRLFFVFCLIFNLAATAQVYSPKLLRRGQPDSTDLKLFSETICRQANAHTPRERAEAIWRFFLTDGRFVKPGFWYHIAGWAYEEPSGEVLDPIKLLNSYGFGLCYHIAPLLEAVYQAAGFQDARCWFLTGHTVTEVFYEGGYHYFDSDMMGYNVEGVGPYKGKPVASVQELARHPEIILGKLDAPNRVKAGSVDDPWYPADVRASAMTDLADLFTTSENNYLYPYTRHSDGHTMDFKLRPGETLTRFFKPEEPALFYLPYRFDGSTWKEFPQEIAEYQIRTMDGPRSQKDNRSWATGRFDYSPPPIDKLVTIIDMPSPYVIIDAQFKLNANLRANGDSIQVETSNDNGSTWTLAGMLHSPHTGNWIVEPKVIAKSAHGRLTAVSGTYGYSVRITKSVGASVDSLHLTSRIQLNPRSLPFLTPGKNEFVYSASPGSVREEISGAITRMKLQNMDCVQEEGQTMLRPLAASGEAIYELTSKLGPLQGFDIGARFLDLSGGLAPNKLTAETRPTTVKTPIGDASIEWSTSLQGPYQQLWKYNAQPTWLDGDAITGMLKWPQTLQRVRNLPTDATRVFVKLRSSGPAIDDIRMAVYTKGAAAGPMQIIQVWNEDGGRRQNVTRINASSIDYDYSISAAQGVENESITFTAVP